MAHHVPGAGGGWAAGRLTRAGPLPFKCHPPLPLPQVLARSSPASTPRGSRAPPLIAARPPATPQYANAGTVKHILLKEMITPRKRLFSQADALRWSLQVAQALEYLHSRNPMVRAAGGGGAARASLGGCLLAARLPAVLSQLIVPPHLPLPRRPQAIHRDLKSENILLTGEHGEPLNARICDFGLHKLVKLALPADSLGSDLAPVE